MKIPPPPSGPVPLAPELSRAMVADMVRIRRLEEKCAQLYGEGKIRGFLHLYIGEEAVAAGAFHESMNLAQLWRLPVAFLCENNLYAMGTALERSESQTDLCVKAAAFGMATLKADGMDVVAVHDAARKACERVRAGEGPVFVEFRTYRFRAHSMFDPELYRDKAEVEQWKTRGPIHTFTARLKLQGQLTEAQFLEMDRAALAEVDAAVAFAEAGTWEPVEELTRHVMAP
jgi:pyruvate dehydrogenase E1 component alpha subunit